MGWLQRIFPRRIEQRSTTWDLLRSNAGLDTDAGVVVSPYLAENLSVVFACVQVISETVAMLPLNVFRKLDGGARQEELAHPIARIFGGDANDWQTASEFIETMTAHCLL